METSDGSRYCGNRRYLIEIPSPIKKQEDNQEATADRRKTTNITEKSPVLQTRSGRAVTKPKRVEILKYRKINSLK